MNDQLNYVSEKVDEQIKYFRSKRRYNRAFTVTFVGASASLSMVATVAIGMSKSLENPRLTIIALIASGLSTVVGAWEALLANRKQWTINNVALAPLYELQRSIEYRTLNSREIEQAEIDKFFARFEEITGAAYNQWALLHSKQ